MRIIGFGIKKLLAEKNDVKNPQMTLNQNINIKDVSKDKLEVTNEDLININFVFEVAYSDKFGKVEIEGNVVILPDKDELKDFLKFQKEKSIPEQFRAPLFNFILSKCNIKALSLEDELNLPYHVQMPKIGLKKE